MKRANFKQTLTQQQHSTTLNLTHIRDIPEENIKEMVAWLNQHPTVTSVNLYGTKLNKDYLN